MRRLEVKEIKHWRKHWENIEGKNNDLFQQSSHFSKSYDFHTHSTRNLIASLKISSWLNWPRPLAHWVDTTWIDKVSPPLYPIWSQIRLSRIGVSMLPRTLCRCVSCDTNYMLSQNVTCCIFGATCDRFVSPIMCVK